MNKLIKNPYIGIRYNRESCSLYIYKMGEYDKAANIVFNRAALKVMEFLKRNSYQPDLINSINTVNGNTIYKYSLNKSVSEIRLTNRLKKIIDHECNFIKMYCIIVND